MRTTTALIFLFFFFQKTPPPEQPADTPQTPEAWMEQAQAAYKNGRPDESLAIAERVIAQFSAAEHPLPCAEALSLRGGILRDRNRHEDALELHRQALAIREKHLGPTAELSLNSRNNIGVCLTELDRLDEAEPHLMAALQGKNRLFPPGSPQLFSVYSAVGHFYRKKGRYRDAEIYLRKPLDWAARLFGPDDPRLLPRWLGLAALFQETGRCDSAVFFLKKALAVQTDTLGPGRELRAATLRSLAACEAAGPSLDAARSLLLQSKNLCQTPDCQAETSMSLGKLALDAGDFADAVEHFRHAAGLFAQPRLRAGALSNLAIALRYQSDPRQALDTLRRAAALLEPLAADGGAPPPLLATIFMNLGSALTELGETDEAFSFFEKSLKINDLQTVEAKKRAAQTLLKMAENRLALARPDEAEPFLSKALPAARELNDRDLLYAVFFKLGELALARNELTAADNFFKKAATQLGPFAGATAVYETIQINGVRAQVQKLRALASGQKQDWSEALRLAETSIGLLENLRGRLREERSELDLQDIFFRVFGIATEACFALDRAEAAFGFSERCKNGFLQKLARQTHLRDASPEANRWFAEEAERKRELAFFEKKRLETAEKSAPEAVSLDSVILAARESLRIFYEKTRTQFPDLAPDAAAEKLPSTAALRQRLRPAETLLEYQWCEGAVALFVLRRDTFVARLLPDTAGLAGQVERFWRLCSTEPTLGVPDDQKPAVFAEITRLGHALCRALLEPARPWLRPELSIVPDGWLCYLPFEALVTQPAATPFQLKKNRWLMADHHVRYLYSAGFLGFWEGKNWPTADKNWLGLAPVFNPETTGLEPLEHNVAEIRSVGKLTGGDVFPEKKATRSCFRERAGDYRVLHLSTHGVMDDADPARSFVAFAEEGGAGGEQPFCYVPEIAATPLRAELVVLSACQTAGGRLFRGAGLASLARAFQSAGARSIVASLWNVDDAHSPDFMAVFYQKLLEKTGKSAALAAAQRASAAGDKFHPYFWAGFVLVGDDAPLEGFGGGWRWSWWWVLVAAAGLFFLKKIWRAGRFSGDV